MTEHPILARLWPELAGDGTTLEDVAWDARGDLHDLASTPLSGLLPHGVEPEPDGAMGVERGPFDPR